MERSEYVSGVFLRHWDRSEFSRKTGEFSIMELGCGDSLASCLRGHSVGAAGYYLVDAGAFATSDIETYKHIASALSRDGRIMPDLSRCRSTADILKSVKAQYLTRGLQSLKALPDKTVDFIWSQAVFEHMGKADFAETMRELRRVIRDDGVMSHRVDLRDHLESALNNLRFSTEAWESPLMSKSGFYTNRICYQEMLGFMSSAGFDVEVVRVDRWEKVPTPRNKLSKEFHAIPDDDLRVSGFDVVLRPTLLPAEDQASR